MKRPLILAGTALAIAGGLGFWQWAFVAPLTPASLGADRETQRAVRTEPAGSTANPDNPSRSEPHLSLSPPRPDDLPKGDPLHGQRVTGAQSLADGGKAASTLAARGGAQTRVDTELADLTLALGLNMVQRERIRTHLRAQAERVDRAMLQWMTGKLTAQDVHLQAQWAVQTEQAIKLELAPEQQLAYDRQRQDRARATDTASKPDAAIADREKLGHTDVLRRHLGRVLAEHKAAGAAKAEADSAGPGPSQKDPPLDP